MNELLKTKKQKTNKNFIITCTGFIRLEKKCLSFIVYASTVCRETNFLWLIYI